MAFPMREPAQEREESCDKHGTFTSRSYLRGAPWSRCPKCAEEEVQERKAAVERAEREDRIAGALHKSGLAGRFKDVAFDNFDVTGPESRKVLKACREYAATVSPTEGAGLWLIGPPGTGKTHLGSAIVRHVIEERALGAAIFSGREIIRMLRATWKTNDGDADGGRWEWPTTEDGLITAFGRISLLVIDEIGASFGSDAEQVQLFDIIDLRYKHRRPTVLLSNLPAKGLKDAIGDRAYDRLREGATVLPCNWDSYRGKPAASKPALQAVPKP